MKNLRVLIMDELHISGDFELLSKELRWLSWKKCPLKCIPSNFPAENLVVLDMRESDIQEFQLNLQVCYSILQFHVYCYCNWVKENVNWNYIWFTFSVVEVWRSWISLIASNSEALQTSMVHWVLRFWISMVAQVWQRSIHQ